jgi:hypothetical protein
VDNPSTETLAVSIAPLDPRLQSWIDTKKIDLHNYTRSHLANQACENNIDQMFTEQIEEHLVQYHHDLDAEVKIRSETLRKTFDNELDTCKASFADALTTAKLQMKKTLDADIEAAQKEAFDALSQEQGRLKHESKIKLQQLRDELDSHSLPSVTRTAKPNKPSPMTPKPKKLKKKPARKPGILEFTPPPHLSDNDEMITDTESITDSIHSPLALRPTDPTPASRPSSTTPTQPAFVPKTNTTVSETVPSTVLDSAAPAAAPINEPKTESSDIQHAPVSEPPTPSRAPLAAAPNPPSPPSEMALLLQAFTGFKAEVTSAISDLNSKVVRLQSGVIPSSQLEESSNYFDDTYDENSNWRGMDELEPTHDVPDTHMTDLERADDANDEFANKLYRRLIDTDIIIPGTYHVNSSSAPNDEFSLVFRNLCKSLSWSPTSYPTATQLPILAQTWAARTREIDEQETLWAARNLFGQLSHKHYAEHDAEFQ